MPKRLTKEAREYLYLYLILRDGGEKCAICGKPPKVLGQFSLEIDHIDNNCKNEDPANKQLACSPCNKRKEIQFRGERKNRKGQTMVNIDGLPATSVAKLQANFAEGSSEMKASGLFEVPFRKWLIALIKEKGGIDRKEARKSGAELVGSSPETIGRYIDKLTSSLGPLQEIIDAIGNKVLIFKPDVLKAVIAEMEAKEQAKANRNKPGPKPKKKKPGPKPKNKGD